MKLLSGLLSASGSAAVMIFALIVLRSLFQDRTPRRIYCLLWDLVLVRLLILAALPSPLSIWRSAPAVSPMAVQGTLSAANSAPVVMETAGASSAAPVSAGTIVSAVWLTVALAAAAWFILNHLSARRVYAASLPCADGFVRDWLSARALRRPIGVRVSDRVAAPLTYGILRPLILLPSGLDFGDRQALGCILEHEYQHILRFDTLRKALLAAAACLHWFNPLVWLMFILCGRDMELLCDEAVTCGGADRAGYARALLNMEERRGRWGLASHFSQNALEERIRSIMKKKHISIAALIAVLIIMCITTTVFASAAPISRAPADDLQVEWWTAEEYAAWLEEEKIVLQSMIGERGYTGSEGWFTWDQTRVDETIAMYESILEQIKTGALYSKTVRDKDGNILEDTMLSSGTLSHADITRTADEAALLSELKAFGITESGGQLSYKGQLIRHLVDGVPVGVNGYSIGYVCSNTDGLIDVHTLRSLARNADGSFDPMGALIGVAAEGDPGFDRELIDCAVFSGAESVVAEDIVTDADLEPYRQFGLDYELTGGELRMSLNGKPVHSLYDTASGTWFANNLHGSELGADAVDLETVYRGGKLCGLVESLPSHGSSHAVFAEGSGDEGGVTLEEIFARYTDYGLSCLPEEGGRVSLSLNGQAVKLFVDIKPDGGMFSYSDPNIESGLRVYTQYDADGALTGLYTK